MTAPVENSKKAAPTHGTRVRQATFETRLEALMFRSRWLLAPLYIGLIISIGMIVLKFLRELVILAKSSLLEESGNLIVGVLSLVDLVMIGNLLVLIIFAGYENFVSKIDTADSEDRPDWMGMVTFADLKMKIIGSIVAISAIELLKSFMNLKAYSDGELGWKVGIHLTFVISGLLFALMDRLTERGEPGAPLRGAENKNGSP